MTRRLDPEDVVSVVDPLMHDLQRIVEAHGGTVLMIAGDGLLCAFGVPHAREDDALRAVRAAHDMRELASRAAGTSGLHAGLASGEVLITPDSSPRGWGITGLCVALATRLADLAKSGVILADTECRRLSGTLPQWGQEYEAEIQGMGEAACAVAELESIVEEPAPRPLGDFVDRMVQQARLEECLAAVASERVSQVVSLRGEAGAGKTRLVGNWLESHPEVTVIKGRCRSYGDERPLAGVLDAVLEHLRIHDLLTQQALVGLLSWLPLDEAEAVAARLLAAASGSSAWPPAEDVGLALARAVRELLRALAAQVPVVLVVDDGHWAGPDLVAFLNDLSATPESRPLLVVVLLREGQVWGDLPPLESLPAWASKQLVLGRLAGAHDDVVDALVSRTGGNPLYLEESLNLLQDGAADAALSTGVPSSIRALLAARLDALTGDAKEVALVVSAGADISSVEAIRALSDCSDLDESLRLLVSRGVLVNVSGGYRFAHRMFQEVAYASLTRTRRVQLHIAHLGLLDDENPGLRAFHAEAAWRHLNTGSPERLDVALMALRELKALGDVVSSWQAAAAELVFSRAAPIIDDVVTSSPGPAAAVLAAHAQVLVDLVRLDEALTRARHAVELVDAAGETDWEVEAAARLALGHVLARQGQMASARHELDRVLGLADAAGDRALRGHALKVLAETWRFESEARFRELLESSHAELLAAGDVGGQAQVARLLAYVLSTSGSRDFQRWYAIASSAQSLDDLRGRAMIARIGCFFAAGRADWLEARDVAGEAMEWGRRAGLADVVTDALLVAVTANTFLGDSQRALAHRDDLLAQLPDLPPRARAAVACASALALVRAGRVVAGRDQVQLAAQLVDGFGEHGRLLQGQAAAEVALDVGDWAGARDAAEAAERLSFGQGLMGLQLGLIRCRASLALGDVPRDDIRALVHAARDVDALPLLLLAAAVERQATLAADDDESSASLPPQPHVEARAIWFENAAMRAADDDEARANWQRAHDEWARLGHTIWPQRALKARDLLPRSLQELAAIPLTPLLDLTAPPSDA